MHECLEFLDAWRLYPLKTQFSMLARNIDTVEKEHVKMQRAAIGLRLSVAGMPYRPNRWIRRAA